MNTGSVQPTEGLTTQARTPRVGVLCYTLDPPASKLLNRMAEMAGVRVKAYPLVWHPYVEPEPRYEVRPTTFRGRFIAIQNGGLDCADVQLFSLSAGTAWALGHESDVVVLFGIHSIPAIVSAILAWVRGKPIISCCLTVPPQAEVRRSVVIRWLKKFVFHLTTVFVSESKASRETLKAVYHIADDRIVNAPFESGGVLFEQLWRESKADRDTTRAFLPVEAGDCLFLFTGSLNRLKGVDVLLDATALLREKGKKVKVVIVGADGAPPHGCRAALEGQGAKLGISDDVRFLGRIPPATDELVSFYRAADVFVLPTRKDTWGKVLVEAAIAGLPLITTDVCAAANDLVRDGINGFVVPVNSGTALAEAMAKLLDRELRARMGAKAREVVQQYIDAQAETRGYHEAFARALGYKPKVARPQV